MSFTKQTVAVKEKMKINMFKKIFKKFKWKPGDSGHRQRNEIKLVRLLLFSLRYK